jgi:L-asparaginase II
MALPVRAGSLGVPGDGSEGVEMSRETIAPGTGAQFNSFQSLVEAQRGYGPEKRLQSHCKSAHAGFINATCAACTELLSYIHGEPMDKRNS